jgi:cellobiose transport system permease protein
LIGTARRTTDAKTRPSGAASRDSGTPHRPRRWRESATPYLYISPFFIIFGLFGLFPLLFNGWVSLHNWNPIGAQTWAGLDNFARLARDPRFWNALANTISILVLSSVPMLAAALALASILNHRLLLGKTFFRMSLLVPNITSALAVGVVFTSIFGTQFGLLNYAFEVLGLPRIDWAAGSVSSHVAIATMIAWRWTGYTVLIFLAAMQAIPRELYEVAELDGASPLRRLRSVTIPALRPTIVFVIILTTIGSLQVFSEPLVFGGNQFGVTGGAERQFQTVVMFLYEQAFATFRFGYAAAIAWTLVFVILVLSLVNLAMSRRIATD